MQKEQTKSVANPNNIREENYSKKTIKVIGDISKLTNNIYSVSYTHLDVYKRQWFERTRPLFFQVN